MYLAANIVGVLSLIILPGVVVWAVTKELHEGIQLSGAITPVVLFVNTLVLRSRRVNRPQGGRNGDVLV